MMLPSSLIGRVVLAWEALRTVQPMTNSRCRALLAMLC
jgi:hypothetical protein